jgi:hypothetical protein
MVKDIQGPVFGATILNKTHKASIGVINEIVLLLIQNIILQIQMLVNVCNK